jgi:hypothetical protein
MARSNSSGRQVLYGLGVGAFGAEASATKWSGLNFGEAAPGFP